MNKVASSRQRRVELNCVLCCNTLTSLQSSLSEDVLNVITEQNVQTKIDYLDYNKHPDIIKDQVIATKCGHMFHIGCLRNHIKGNLEKGSALCPICSKTVTLTRIWPVLIPPTPLQLQRFKKMHAMKTQNTTLRTELKEIRKEILENEKKLLLFEEQTIQSLDDIQLKEKQLEALNGPTDEELDELRKIHKKRQSIVRVVTKHNADLLGVLMHETNVQMSDIDLPDDLEDTDNNNQFNYHTKSPRHRGRGCPLPVATREESNESYQEIDDLSSATFSENVSREDNRLYNNWRTHQPQQFVNCPAYMGNQDLIAQAIPFSKNSKKHKNPVGNGNSNSNGKGSLTRRDGTRELGMNRIDGFVVAKEPVKNSYFKKPPIPPKNSGKEKVRIRPKWC